MIQVCLRWKITACSENEALLEAMSFMPNQAAKALAMMNGTQMKPAFCSHSGVSAPPCWIMLASPPSAPNTPTVITNGTTNWTTLTPRLPRPALSAKALPFSALGKKKVMFDIEEAKLPPPKPHNSASARNSQ
jgi:hypothetical protein